MFAKFAVGTLLFAVQAFGKDVNSLDYPGDYCCTLWEAAGYEWSSVNLCLPTDSDTGIPTKDDETFLLKNYGFDNIMSSWWCGKYVSYDFCVNETGDCTGQNGDSGAGNIMVPSVGHNDQISRVELHRYGDGINRPFAMVVFAAANCQK